MSSAGSRVGELSGASGASSSPLPNTTVSCRNTTAATSTMTSRYISAVVTPAILTHSAPTAYVAHRWTVRHRHAGHLGQPLTGHLFELRHSSHRRVADPGRAGCAACQRGSENLLCHQPEL